ncbi:MAG: pyroglutamyl-peptidase I [Paenibacillus dendritiformis]|uniref:pyroglutamyl-peptidase I n=1 Tax=Paenibacillus dendritiformis TaxID=130049 RepID=UPI00143DF728|nr:pyroglutamyl-peptidase I [Paenibacillus dendritiformis]MDU5141311.1 pyroglutamyl-peptidase I [Paenibacillus dendritiformis]NKI20829.1 pyroglutamyl-peptidase I [Paenibacillus dendritiformis]NRF98541.1 pyroglutamyl-peptidase I [Paenibacillus dendritiformis]GIO72179.1 pyrrolidone-carboxylate peptidase [Paenibacillus dendritiformis]
MSNTLLLTGFDPFGGESINPSWEAVRALDGAALGRYRVQAAQLPTSFARAGATLRDAMAACDPAAVICVGQAGGRPDITLERVAINLADARIADNDGNQPTDDEVVPGGPAAYWATLPVKALRRAVLEAGIPCSVSYTAGTFVCNSIFYTLMHELAGRHEKERIPAGFIHIPFLPQQAAAYPGKPSMSLDSIVQALRAVILHADAEEERGASAGTLHG